MIFSEKDGKMASHLHYISLTTNDLFLHIKALSRNYVLAVTHIDCTTTVQKIKFFHVRVIAEV